MHYANNLFKFFKDIKSIAFANPITYYCYLQYDTVLLSQKMAHQNMQTCAPLFLIYEYIMKIYAT